ncbi:tRNA lysidine(34) synthetase TilS [Psychromicrobium xiongbiense]|uniref:tRNA lysidine(34) synthetase TilS n=1 Tax=Psychromicrobium xiongbiense TaxID=3051184 RepID=UPI0025575406|nr:tRNA lysidine(34) synthetase TilS [Psychromicrobium sp. YIM S02556]
MGQARQLVRKALDGLEPPLNHQDLILVACSGGPDSLALAAVTAFFGHRGNGHRGIVRVGAVVVDHGLQEGSAEVAAHTAHVLTGLGLDPVLVRTVQVADDGGPEAAARQARYAAFAAAARESGARAVLLGHTLDDQAEQVLLGLARGSGTRSLAGMPARRLLREPAAGDAVEAAGVELLRPFLTLRRAGTEELCRGEGLEPWHDPSNRDARFARSRARNLVLPVLERQLGPGVAPSLARSAAILAQDAEYLDELAAAKFEAMVEFPEVPADPSQHPGQLLLPEAALNRLPAALRQRVLAIGVVRLGGAQPSYERLLAAESLLQRRGSAGPIQLEGGVSAYRISRSAGQNYGKLVLKRHR